jgi:hypothetical protein
MTRCRKSPPPNQASDITYSDDGYRRKQSGGQQRLPSKKQHASRAPIV